MTLTSVLAAIAVVGLGTAQYILMVQALRDLARRSRVRGDNKMAWALLIMCVPIVGPVVYGWMGPTSLLRRQPAEPSQIEEPTESVSMPPPYRKITPIDAARRSDRSEDGLVRTPPTRRFRRTGS